MAETLPALFEEKPSRYVVGIDLGTTNCAVCYVDTTQRAWKAEVLAIPQLVAPRQIEARDTLPSFHYQPPHVERQNGALRLPWDREDPAYAVGFVARDYGGQVSGRVVASAKSWLCHSGVDRTRDILPWHAAEDVEKLSPVEVSSRYLKHLRAAWNHQFRSEPLENQDIVLTLPASFDEVARELTIEAARKAGLARVILIEEPQAAFYAWLHKHRENWQSLVSPGQKILVCDIGGGTTDFTLIRVRGGEAGESSQRVQFHRVAVGDHLILGGDNFDLALAQHLEQKITRGGKLEPRQWDVLVRVARQVKEQMLSGAGQEQQTVSLPGSGTKLIGGALQTQVTREEVQQVLVEGFMPRVALADRPQSRRSGFQEFGLPYAVDPAITRYLAAFLSAHRHAGDEDAPASYANGVDPARPDVVLFNGGVFDSPLLRKRLIDLLVEWFAPASESNWRPILLENDRLDLAVARGAAYFGMVRRGEGVRIAASLARTYYLGVDAEPPAAVCLVPGSAQAGRDITLERPQFELLVSQPAEFPLYVSSVRLTDQAGEVLTVDAEQFRDLPPIRTALNTRRRSERGTVPVKLHARLTEIGTLELWCSEVGGERTWRLEFDIRSTTQTDKAAHESRAEREGFVDEATWQACANAIHETFGHSASLPPDSLLKRLTDASGMERHEWPTSLLRRVWEALLENEPGRRKSPLHEARWLNMLGYALRPGYGLAVDDWRVAETWRTVHGKLAFTAATSRTESLILWRRIAGGFTSGQQQAIAEPLIAQVRALHKRHTSGKAGDATFSAHEGVEVLRLLGSLELLPAATKQELGKLLADLLPKRKLEQLRPALAWSLGRLGARTPVYGPLNTILPPSAVAPWIESLLELSLPDAQVQFAVVQLARMTGDRFRDLSAEVRTRVLGWLKQNQAAEHAEQLVRELAELTEEEQTRAFGEALPKGLRIA
jgi:molecular chaperone DnaK (HSP70)